MRLLLSLGGFGSILSYAAAAEKPKEDLLATRSYLGNIQHIIENPAFTDTIDA